MDDKDLQEAQERLLNKREELKVTASPTPLISRARDERDLSEILESVKEKVDSRSKAQKEYDEKFAREMDEKYADIIDDKEKRATNWLIHYGIPVRYKESSLDNFTGNEKIVHACKTAVKTGDILLTGSTGGGKTHLAVAILRSLVMEILPPLRLPGQPPMNNSPIDAMFVTVPKLLMNLRASFNGGGKIVSRWGEREASEQEIIEHYSNCDFLILDDLGAEKTTDYALSALYIIIDNRINELKRTIVTTNLSLPELEEKMDARIASRLSSMKIIKISMPDYRKKR